MLTDATEWKCQALIVLILPCQKLETLTEVTSESEVLTLAWWLLVFLLEIFWTIEALTTKQRLVNIKQPYRCFTTLMREFCHIHYLSLAKKHLSSEVISRQPFTSILARAFWTPEDRHTVTESVKLVRCKVFYQNSGLIEALSMICDQMIIRWAAMIAARNTI